MLDGKKITIIIATFNAGKTLERCLSSITPQLTDETELILIDGGSTDNTLQIIDHHKDKISYFVTESDKGIYDAWNKGVKKATGDWVMFVGADDILLPNAIDTYLTTIHSAPDIDQYDYICARNRYVDNNGQLLTMIGEKPDWYKMRKRMIAAHVASLHSLKRLFKTIGLYNLDFKICADYELLMRKKSNLRSLMLDAEIAQMQIGGMSFSKMALVEAKRIRSLHNSVHPITNTLIYWRDYLAFVSFKWRKSVKMSLRNLFCKRR